MSSTSPSPANPGNISMLKFAAFLGCIAFAGLAFFQLFRTMAWHFESTTELGLEKPTVNSILLLKDGANIFSERVIQSPPFQLQLYFPAYPYLVAALPSWPDHAYRTPRMVSALFMILAGSSLLWRARSPFSAFLALGLAALFLVAPPVITDTFYARSDPMALFFSVASIHCLATPNPTHRNSILSALFAFLAIISKQSYVAATLTGLSFLVLRDRRLFASYLLTLLGLLGSGALLAHTLWGNSFWWSTVTATSMGFDSAGYRWMNYVELPMYVFSHVHYLAFVVLLVFVIGFGIQTGTLFKPPRILLLYFFVSVGVLSLTLGKNGAWLNYFFEPILSGLLLIGTVFNSMEPVTRLRLGAAAAWLFMAGLLIELNTPMAKALNYSTPPENAENEQRVKRFNEAFQELEKISQETRHRPLKSILCVPPVRDESISVGRIAVLSDPFLYELLIRSRLLSSNIFSDSLKRKEIDLVVMLPREGSPAYFGGSFQNELSNHYERIVRPEVDFYLPKKAETEVLR